MTGGSSGIGTMIAAGFVQNGAKVYISSRKASECSKVASSLTKQGPGVCIALPEDLSTEKGVLALAEKFLKLEEKLHVLVNNSGISWGASFESFPDHAWDKVLALNLKTVFNLTRAVLPALEKAGTLQDPARVINIGSIAGIKPQVAPTYSYDCSKAAVHSLTQKLAAEFASKKIPITVNAIAPGLVPSKMSKQLLVYASEEDQKKGVTALGRIIPLGRVGCEGDMAGAALFFASRAGSWLTGVILAVDGGALSESSKMHLDSHL